MSLFLPTQKKLSAYKPFGLCVLLLIVSGVFASAGAQTNYYTYQSGDWGSATTWTTDASGITSVGAAVPAAIDNITILNGYTVTTGGANRTSASLTIASGGFLSIDNATFANHDFGTVSGQGTIRTVTGTIGGTANYTNFLGAAGGTVQFEVAADFTLPGGTGNTTLGATTVTQYRNLTLNLNAATTTATLAQTALTISGNLTLTQGTFQINDATTRRCTLTVSNDVSVAANGRIRVGTGNNLLVDLGIGNRPTAGTAGYSLVADGTHNHPSDGYYHAIFHQFYVGGNFTNNGSVRFTNQTVRRYDQFAGLDRGNGLQAADQGAATVIFTGAQNNTVTCNGLTDFYNIVVNKGVDRTYVLTINSTAYANFELWGPVSAGPWDGGSAAAYGQTVSNDDPEMRKPLYIIRGTARLQGQLRIWTFSEGQNDIAGTRGDYEIGLNAGLWIDGAIVQTTAITTSGAAGQTGDLTTSFITGSQGINNGTSWQGWITRGLFRISNGWFTSMNSAGAYIYPNANAAQFIVEGGTVDFSQLSGTGAPGSFAYVQTNGNVYLRSNRDLSGAPYNVSTSVYGAEFGGRVPFDIPNTTSSFVFTGGTLTMCFNNANSPEFRVLSSSSNFSVTNSGLVRVLLNDGDNFEFQTTAPLPALTIGRLTGTGAATTQIFTGYPLTIQGDLTVNDNVTLDANNQNLSVGGNFTFTSSAAGTAAYNNQATTTLAGTSNSSIILTNNTAAPTLTLNALTINKTGGVNADSVTVRSPGRTAGTIPLRVTGTTTLTAGDLNVLGYAVSLQGNVINSDTITSLVSAGSVITAGRVLLDGTAAQTLSGTSGVYGNLQVNKTGGSVTLGSNMSLTGELSLASATVLNAATYGVRIQNATGLVYGNAGGTALADFDATRMIQFNGNDSDGGFTYGGTGSAAIASDVTRFFPIGIAVTGTRAIRFTPVNAVIGRTGSGTFTVNPIGDADNTKLPTLNGTYAANNAYSLTFRLRTSGFTACSLNTGSILYYPATDNTSGAGDGTWVAGRVWIPIAGSAATRQDISSLATWNTTPDPGTVTVGATPLPLNTASLGDSRITVGVAANFTGNLLTFYSLPGCGNNWDNNATWNRSDLMTAGQLASPYQNYGAGTRGASSTAGVGYPSASDIAYIGFSGAGAACGVFHQPGAATNIAAAELHFATQPVKGGCDTWIDRPFFETRYANHNISFGLVEGNGVFAVGPGVGAAQTPILNNIDFGDFSNKPEAIFLIQGMNADGTAGAGNGTWPLNFDIPGLPTTFPSLRTYAGAYQSATIRFTNNFTVNQDILMEGGTRFLLGDGTTNPTLVTVNGNVNFYTPDNNATSPSNWPNFHAGRIVFQNTGNATTLQVNGNINFSDNYPVASTTVDSSQIVVEGGGTAALIHSLRVGGNITNVTGTTRSQGLTLFTNAASAKCDLEMFGTTNATISDAGTNNSNHIVNRFIINKGTTQAPTVTVTKRVDASGDASIANKPLTLQNGTLILNFNASNATTYTLTSAGDYTIPQTAAVQVGTNATLQFDPALATATNLILNGGLTVNGGTVSLNGNGTAEHSITYGSASPTLNISSGTLDVGGQIRQPTTSTTGNLNYTQSGGTVTVGRNSAPVTDRGVFEIDNAGSAFNMSGGSLNLVRVNGSQIRPALWLNPGSSTVSGGTVQLGTTSPATPAATTFQLYTASNVTLPNVVVNTTNAPTAQVVTLPIRVGNLTVNNGASFLANSNAVSISGDLTVTSGTYNANNVVTTFNRSAASNQTITNTAGTVTFGSLTMNRSAGNSLVAANDFTVNQNLTLTQGSFSTGTTTITVLGNVTNNAGTAGHVSGTSGGILLQGASAQQMGGSGTFGRVTINNTQGITATGNINVDGAAAANATFSLQNGIMAMGSNFFNLSGTATFASIPASTFSNTKMVTASGSGVGGFRKTFSGSVTGYQIPIGVGTFYTPVTINFPSTSGGVFTITPVNNITPAAVSPLNVLNYYWQVTATGFTSGSGTLVAQWPSGITSPNFPTNYVPAQLQTAIATPGWVFGTTTDVTSGDPRTATFTFPSPGDNNAITGQYTVGQTASLPAPQTYTTTAAGTWETVGNWTPTPPAGGPQGSLVVINHAIDITTLNRNALTTNVGAAGTLNVGTTVGHNFGNISGTGIIAVTPSGGSGLPPAGSYTGFTGTLQFGGTNAFTLIGTSLGNNWPGLTHNGTNTMTLQAGTVNVANAFTIGNTGAVDLATNNTALNLQGNLVRSGTGTLTMNNTSAITLNGTGTQNITTGTGGLTVTNLNLNKATGGVTITAAASSPLTISNNMDFTSGIITTTTSTAVANQTLNFGDAANWTIGGGAFSFSNLTNCSPASYVNGAVLKTVSSASQFIFPTGNSVNGTSALPIPFRPIRISNNPTAGQWVAVYNNAPHPNTTLAGGLQSLLTPREYWQVNGPNSGSANVTTYWGCNSLVGTATQTDVDNGFKVINFTGANWTSVASSKDGSSAPSAGSVTTTAAFGFSIQTFGVGSTTGPLPVTWLYVRGKSVGTYIALDWATGSEVNNNRFEVERSVDGRQYTKIGSVLGNGTTNELSLYAFQDVDYPQVRMLYYRLKQVDDNGEFAYSPTIEVMLEGGSTNENQWAIAPNPTNGEYFSLLVIGGGIDPLNDLHTVQLVSQQGSTLVNVKARLNDVGIELRRALQNAPSGIYHLRVLSGKYSQSLKVVRE